MPNYRYNSPSYMRQGMNRRNMPPARMPRMEPEHQECCDNNAEHDDLRGMPVAMAYVPWTHWRNIYETEKGFHRGTIFMDLDKPFCGIGGCQHAR